MSQNQLIIVLQFNGPKWGYLAFTLNWLNLHDIASGKIPAPGKFRSDYMWPL